MKKPAPIADRPQAAQLDAIRRLIDNDSLAEAEDRIAHLPYRYPHCKPPLGLAWEAAQATGDFHAAVTRLPRALDESEGMFSPA